MVVDNLILIKGGAHNDVKKALSQWIELYSKVLKDGMTFQLYNSGNNSHIIQADKHIDNESFYYLINYLNYPEGIKYEIDVEGFTIGKDKNKLNGKQLLVYISPNDTDYDNVFVTTSENENFKVDFGGKITEENENKLYSFPNDLSFGISEIITVENIENLNQNSESAADPLEKRFKIVSIVVIAAFALTFLFFKTEESFFTINYAIAFAVFGWLLYDYKILQIDSLYYGSVGLGLTILLFGYLLNEKFSNEDNSLLLMGTSMPIFFLTIQRPLRFAFIRIMKREPIVDRPSPSFADSVYVIILLLSSILTPTFFFSR